MKHRFLSHILIRLAALLTAATVGTLSLRAQSLDPFNPYSSIAPSAETFEMVRYGGLTPSLYTGAMSYSVPVFTYEDPDFSIPVSLDYHFDGYKPAQHSGTVGYGWSLNCGGVITREVRGIPDDDCFYGSGDRPAIGYYWTAQSEHAVVSRSMNDTVRWGTVCNSGAAGIPTETAIHKINPFVHIPLHSTVNLDYQSWLPPITGSSGFDMTPDIYHFQFFGHSGDFMFMPDGSVRAFNSDFPQGEIRIEFRPVDAVRRDNEVLSPGFVITTGDGMRYYFGDYYDNMEYVRAVTSMSPNSDSWSVVAFRLYKIEAPNGRSVTFSYSHRKQTSLLSQCYYTPKYEGPGNNTPSNLEHRYNRVHFPILTAIHVDESERIRFSYEIKNRNEDAEANYDSYRPASTGTPLGVLLDPNPLRLDKIELLNESGVAVQRASLEQEFAASGTPKMFLSSIQVAKGGTHRFMYNNASSITFPHNDTQGTDHWGYWNGEHSFDPRTYVRPNVSRFEQMIYSVKGPDVENAQAGALTQILHPTGGATEIEYEGNMSEKGIEEQGQLWEPENPFPVGGLRVRKLIDRASVSSVPDTSIFRYEGGVLYYMPRYALKVLLDFGPASQGDPETYDYYVTGYNGDVDYAVSSDHHIGYSSVTRTHPDHSETVTEFSSYDNGYKDLIGMETDWASEIYPLIWKRNVITPGDKIICGVDAGSPDFICASVDYRNMRGRPLSIIIRDNQGVVRIKKQYSYGADTVSLNWIYMNNIDSFIAIPWKSLNAVQTGETVTEYLADGQVLSSSRHLDYNDAGQLTRESVWSLQQPDDTLQTRFCYLHEAGLPDSPAALPGALYMAARTRSAGNSCFLLDGVRYGYESVSLHIKPSVVEKFRIEEPIPLSTRAVWTDAVNALPVDETIRFSYHDDTIFPTEVRMPGDTWVRYTWTGLHPTAKQINSTANCFFYTWKDQVGLKMLTSPTGTSETYEYDANGRLRQVKDADAATITVYDYRLSNDE